MKFTLIVKIDKQLNIPVIRNAQFTQQVFIDQKLTLIVFISTIEHFCVSLG